MNKNNDTCAVSTQDAYNSPDYKAMYEAEHDRYYELAEKHREMRFDYEKKTEAMLARIRETERELEIAKAQLEIVRLIFGRQVGLCSV